MTKSIILKLSFLVIVFCAWKPCAKHVLNSNTWCMQIDGKDLLVWTKNNMGDEVKINLKSIKPTTVLHAQRYLCGQTADKTTTILTIKNGFNKTIKEVSHKNSSIMFEADLPLKDIVSQFSTGETMSVYFAIKGDASLSSTVLLGRLKLQ